MLLQCGDIEPNSGPKNKYKNKAFLRKQCIQLKKENIFPGFRQCYKDEDDLQSLSITGFWGRLSIYLGRHTSHLAMGALKRWCYTNNIIEEFFMDDGVKQKEEVDDFTERDLPSISSYPTQNTTTQSELPPEDMEINVTCPKLETKLDTCKEDNSDFYFSDDEKVRKNILKTDVAHNSHQVQGKAVEDNEDFNLNEEISSSDEANKLVLGVDKSISTCSTNDGRIYGNLENTVEKVSYNLRPGRHIQSNKRYFNEMFDCTTKRKKRTVHNKSQNCIKEVQCTDQFVDDFTLGYENCMKNHNFQYSGTESSLSAEIPDIECYNDSDTEDTSSPKSTHDPSVEGRPDKNERSNLQLLTVDNSFSMNTLEKAVGVSCSEPFFEKTVPEDGYFYISEEDWENLCAIQKGRCFSNGNWERIIANGIKDANPYCVYMFRWHEVSVARKRKSISKPIFRGEGFCKFPDCQNRLTFSMDKDRKVHFSMSSTINHDIVQHYARPFRGEKRKEIGEKLREGPKPYKYYMEKFSSVNNEVKLAGNFSDFGNSPQTFQKIASESRFSNTLDKSEFESLLKIAEKMSLESTAKRLPGFVRHISIYPPVVMYWTEMGVRIWHDMAKNATVFWDATGSVIRQTAHRPRFYYYEITCMNPTKGQNVIPVASLLSTLHSTPMIRFWISEFRRSEKKLFGHGNVAIPKQIKSDRSLVFIQAALSEFNNETLDDFRSRAWRIITGKATSSDTTKIIPHACLSHVMSSFKKVAKDVYKSNLEFGMYCFSLILNSATLSDVQINMTSVYHVLLAKTVDSNTEAHLRTINERLAHLPKKMDKETDVEREEEIEAVSIFPEFAQASKLTEEDYLNRSTTNAFYHLSEEILQEANKTSNPNFPENRYYSSTLMDRIHRLFMPTLPLWSNLLLGDLSRHGADEVYRCFRSNATQVRGNTSIEKRFQILKDISLGGKPVHRIDEFSVQLQTHVEAVQNLAIIKHLKVGGKDRKGRSTRTGEEEWDKKPQMTNVQISGKYQKPPKNVFLFNDRNRENRQKKTNRKDEKTKSTKSKERSIENTTELHEAPSTYRSNGTIEICPQSSHTHNCDSGISMLIRKDGCIGKRQLLPSKRPYIIKREDDIVLSTSYGLPNTGNSCWFNAVLSALCSTDIMQLALDKFNKDLTFCPKLIKTLTVANNVNNGAEVSKTIICDALNDLQDEFRLDAKRQNDAHEFLTSFLSTLTSSLDYRNTRIREIISCLSCGKVITHEEEATSISLRIPDRVASLCIKDLLDDFFMDECIEGAECDVCFSKHKYKKCVPVHFPGTVILALQRYKVNKWDQVEKDRSAIYSDDFINFKQYTTQDRELIYKLEGVVMHRGQQPTSGHYTALRKAVDKYIIIDNEIVQVYRGETLNKDGYLLLYSSLEISNSYFIYMSCCCISYSAICDSLQHSMTTAVFTSPIKRQMLERIRNFKVFDNEVPADGRLLYLIHRSQIPTQCTIDFVENN